jgi:hypothetical protein
MFKKNKGARLPIPPRRVAVKPHSRSPRGSLPPKAPMPGPNEFSPEDEQAMRQGASASRTPAMPPGPPPPDDVGEM